MRSRSYGPCNGCSRSDSKHKVTVFDFVAKYSVLKFFMPLEKRRRWLLDRAPKGPLRDYYKAPFPTPRSTSGTVDYLALDFETTGLNPNKDEILSIGFVGMRGHALKLSEYRHYLVRPVGAIPESSAVIHGILDDKARAAVGLDEALPPLLQALTGRVMVAHYARIEYLFLDHACRQIYGFPFIGPVVDTFELERRCLDTNIPVKPGTLRLANLRERYGLPRYRAHNALVDAISAAELLLAQIAYRAGKQNPSLKELMVSM